MSNTIQESASSKFDVSVVIVSFNTRDVLRECLLSVYREVGLLHVQVIVVDNASTDGSPAMIKQDFPEVVLILSEVNLGFGRANNLGFQSALGRYIVILNSDAFLTEGSLERAVAHMDANPKAGLGGGRLIGRDGSWQPSARMFPSVFGDLIVLSGLAARFPQSRFFGRADRTWANQMEAAAVDWVPGAFSIIRAEVLAAAGPFDPRFFLYSEEVDLCKRIKQKGYEIWYWPDIAVVHIGGESSRQIRLLELSTSGSQLTLWRVRSMLLYYRKHHGMNARLAMLVEIVWYWIRSKKRRLSRDSNRRTEALADRRLVSIMTQAWRETRGGRVSPSQPW
ncbi:MAG: glycosyltransferase family 2 protein [Terracidiphilus sp.]|jgi:GT2 family glycosyltransferase